MKDKTGILGPGEILSGIVRRMGFISGSNLSVPFIPMDFVTRALMFTALFLQLNYGSMIKSFLALEKSKVADNFSYCMGIKCKNGILLTSVQTPFQNELRWLEADRKCIHSLKSGIVFAFAGTTADIEFILKVARECILSHKSLYKEEIKPYVLAQKLAEFLYDYSSDESARKLGISFIITSKDVEKEDLYLLKGNGEMRAYHVCKLYYQLDTISPFLNNIFTPGLYYFDGVS